MAKLIPLGTNFLTALEGVLNGGLTLGPALKRNVNLKQGSLTVWIPDEFVSLEKIVPSSIDQDIFYPASVGRDLHLVDLLHREVSVSDSAVIMTETSHSKGDLTIADGAYWWLDVLRSSESAESCVVACLERRNAQEESIRGLLREASGYPSVTALSTATPMGVHSGSVYRLSREQDRQLMNNVQLIAVGVFDESSSMIWRRFDSPQVEAGTH